MLGDVNDDDMVDINDAVTLANYLIGQTPAIFISDVADVNQDGEVSIADVTTIINNVLVADAKADLTKSIKTSKEKLNVCKDLLDELDSNHDQTELWDMVSHIETMILFIEATIYYAATEDDIRNCQVAIISIDSELATLNVRIMELRNG